MRAFAKLEDAFPVEFAVYNLKPFLTFLDLLGSESELVFSADHVSIGEKKSGQIKFFYSSPNVIKTLNPITPSVNMNSDAVVKLDASTIKTTLKAAASLACNYVAFTSDGTLKAYNPDNSSGDTFEIEVATTKSTDKEFVLVLSVDNMKKLLAGDYTVTLDTRGISHFVGNGIIDYYIGIEKEFSRV